MWEGATFLRKPAVGLNRRKHLFPALFPACKLKFSREDHDVIRMLFLLSFQVQVSCNKMASIISVKEDFYFVMLIDFVLDSPGRICCVFRKNFWIFLTSPCITKPQQSSELFDF